MSKYVKNLLTEDLKRRLEGVNEALLVNVTGMTAVKNSDLRRTLRKEKAELLVVKNSMARRATEGTPLAAAFNEMEGSLAIVWGAEDIVSLAKLVIRLSEDKNFAPFAPRGGVMEGAQLTAEKVKEVSKWPSRAEQLSILVAQLLSPGANLLSQLIGPGGTLASQIKQKAEGESDGAAATAETAAAEAPAETPPAAEAAPAADAPPAE